MIGDFPRKEITEEPKLSDRSVEVKRTKQSNHNENRTENSYVEKEQQDSKNENNNNRIQGTEK